jgi:hypothetical protein
MKKFPSENLAGRQARVLSYTEALFDDMLAAFFIGQSHRDETAWFMQPKCKSTVMQQNHLNRGNP